MYYKVLLAGFAACLSCSAASAQSSLELDEFFVNCMSDKDQSFVTLVRSGGSNKGYIITNSVEGEADIYPGLDSMTFLLLQEDNLITFVVDYSSLQYDMMTKGGGQNFDHGSCSES